MRGKNILLSQRQIFLMTAVLIAAITLLLGINQLQATATLLNVTIAGTLYDNDGAPVPNKSVFLERIDSESGQTVEFQTDENGAYEVKLTIGQAEETWRFQDEYPLVVDGNYEPEVLISWKTISLSNSGPTSFLIDIEGTRQNSAIRGMLIQEDGSVYDTSDGWTQILFRNQTSGHTFRYYAGRGDWPNGVFQKSLYAGTYNIYVSPSRYFQGFELTGVTLSKETLLDLEDVVVPTFRATIYGQVLDDKGIPATEGTVIAEPDIRLLGRGYADIDANGAFTMTIQPGTFYLSTEFEYGSLYQDQGPASQLVISNRATVTGVELVVDKKSGSIAGNFVVNGNRVTDLEAGDAMAVLSTEAGKQFPTLDAYPGPILETPSNPQSDTDFERKVWPGRYILSFIFQPDRWFAQDPGLIDIGPDSDKRVDIELEEASATVDIRFIDGHTGSALDPDNFTVTASYQNYERVRSPEDDNARQFDLIPGEWSFDWSANSQSIPAFGPPEEVPYVVPKDPILLSLEENQTETLSLPVFEIDSSFSGELLTEVPDHRAELTATGIGELAGLFVTQTVDVSFRGELAGQLPHGEWRLQLKPHLSEYYISEPVTVTLEAENDLSGVEFDYSLPNATLSGTARVLGWPTTWPIELEAISVGKGRAYGDVNLVSDGLNAIGSFVFQVQQGEIILKPTSSYRPGMTVLTVSGDTTRDLVVYPHSYGPEGKTDLITGEEGLNMSLTDGSRLTIPPNTFDPNSIYHVEFTTNYDVEVGTDEFPVQYGYTVAISPRFEEERVTYPTQNPIQVELVYPYKAPWGLDDPSQLSVMAYSEVSGEWETVDGFELDPTGRTMTFSSAEHSKFTIMGPTPESFDMINTIPFSAFLPVIDN